MIGMLWKVSNFKCSTTHSISLGRSDSIKHINKCSIKKNFFDKVSVNMISKAIEGSITNNSLKKLRLSWKEYEWSYDGGLIRNDGPTMIYLLFKIINPATQIDISNLKEETERSTISKFVNHIKDIIDRIHSNIPS